MHLSNEVIPKKERGNSQTGSKTRFETPAVPDMTGAPPDGIPFTLPENGDTTDAAVPMREPGEEDDEEEGDIV